MRDCLREGRLAVARGVAVEDKETFQRGIARQRVAQRRLKNSVGIGIAAHNLIDRLFPTLTSSRMVVLNPRYLGYIVSGAVRLQFFKGFQIERTVLARWLWQSSVEYPSSALCSSMFLIWPAKPLQN